MTVYKRWEGENEQREGVCVYNNVSSVIIDRESPPHYCAHPDDLWQMSGKVIISNGIGSTKLLLVHII